VWQPAPPPAPGAPSVQTGVAIGCVLGLGRAMFALGRGAADGSSAAWLAALGFAAVAWVYHAEGVHFHPMPWHTAGSFPAMPRVNAAFSAAARRDPAAKSI
jgi:hypothetical protein